MKFLHFFALLGVAVILTACNGAPLTLTQENLDKIEDGMSSSQVKAILGSPTDSKSEPIPVVGGTKTTYYYSRGDDQVVVVLKNDTVQSKEGSFSSK